MGVPKRTSKVVSMEQAADLVKDGMKISIGGMGSNNVPNAFIREIIRRKIKDITVIPTNVAGYQVDLLIGVGAVKKLYSSFVGLDYPGFAPHFRKQAEEGKLDVVDLDELGLLYALKAGGAGLPFYPLPDGMLAVDNVKTNPDWYKIINDPFTGKKVPVVPPLRADVCIIHAARCDAYGNAQEMFNNEALLHLAADKLIITTEKIIPLEETEQHYTDVTISGYFVDAVVETPYGAHPYACSGVYPADQEHLKLYGDAARDEVKFNKYLDDYIYNIKDHNEYLDKIGASKLLNLKFSWLK
jgi:glutaconate CoA-transferase subunit A